MNLAVKKALVRAAIEPAYKSALLDPSVSSVDGLSTEELQYVRSHRDHLSSVLEALDHRAATLALANFCATTM